MSIKSKTLLLSRVVKGAFFYPREANICLWHAGRCGSTVLSSLLDRDGRFDWKGEYLEKRSKLLESGYGDVEKIWRQGLRSLENDIYISKYKYLGIELKIWHAVRFGKDVKYIFNSLMGLGFTRHVILERRNYLRVYLSGRVLVASGVSHTDNENNVYSKQIFVDVKNALKEVVLCDEFYKQLKKILPADSLYLSYEDHIFEDPRIAYSILVNFFDLQPRDLTVQLKKTNARPAEDLVENWEEVVSAFRDTPYSWMTET